MHKLNLRHDGMPLLLLLIIWTIIDSVASGDESFCKTSEGVPGFCINLKTQIRYCPKMYSWLLSGESDWLKLRDALCSNEIGPDEAKVCCPIDWYDETSKSTDTSDYSSHPNFKLLTHDSKCGYISLSGRIIGGQNSSPGDYPWMARVGLKQNGKEAVFFGCAGTIINSRYILTAAHCVPKVVGGNHTIFVRLAETDESINPESITIDGFVVASSPYIDVYAEDIIVHPGYTGNAGSSHDIALVRVKAEMNMSSSFTQPVCLPFVQEYSLQGSLNDMKIFNRNATVCGWGKTDSNDTEGSAVLQHVEVPIVQNIICRIVYKKGAPITSNQMCAGGLKGMSSCSGDSGGPLTKIAKRDDRATKTKSVRHYQMGIVSFGKTMCGRENEPVVYTRVRSYLKWILDNIKE